MAREQDSGGSGGSEGGGKRYVIDTENCTFTGVSVGEKRLKAHGDPVLLTKAELETALSMDGVVLTEA